MLYVWAYMNFYTSPALVYAYVLYWTFFTYSVSFYAIFIERVLPLTASVADPAIASAHLIWRSLGPRAIPQFMAGLIATHNNPFFRWKNSRQQNIRFYGLLQLITRRASIIVITMLLYKVRILNDLYKYMRCVITFGDFVHRFIIRYIIDADLQFTPY